MVHELNSYCLNDSDINEHELRKRSTWIKYFEEIIMIGVVYQGKLGLGRKYDIIVIISKKLIELGNKTFR